MITSGHDVQKCKGGTNAYEKDNERNIQKFYAVMPIYGIFYHIQQDNPG